MSTRRSRQLQDPCTITTSGGNNAPALSILCNNIELSGEAVKKTVPNFIQSVMAQKGGIVYIRSVNEWASFSTSGKKNRFGFPTSIIIDGEDGEKLMRDIKYADPATVELCVIPANAEFVPPINYINKIINMLNEVDINILQNLDNLRQLTLLQTYSTEAQRELEAIDAQRSAGKTHAVRKARNVQERSPEVINFTAGAQNYLETYLHLKDDLRQEFYEAVGVAKLVEKGERRIVGEVDLAEDSASAVIDLLIQSINQYAEYYNIDIHAERRNRTGKKEEDATATETEEEEEEEEGANNV